MRCDFAMMESVFVANFHVLAVPLSRCRLKMAAISIHSPASLQNGRVGFVCFQRFLSLASNRHV